MAPIQQFLRWLKDKTGQKSNTKITRLRQLPPIPVTYDDYGFRSNDDQTSHIYEEIIYDVPNVNPTDDVIKSPPKSKLITGAMQQLDFSGAKTVGPYLVVPIRKCDDGKKSDRHNLDLIADLKNGDTGKSEYQTLYGMMPDWAKQHLKVNASSQGLVITKPKSYSVDVPPTHSNDSHDNALMDSAHCKQSSIDSSTFLIHSDENDRRQSSKPAQKVQKRCYRSGVDKFNEYEVPLFDSSREDYEYFLIKTAKNLKIEQELRNYLNGTPTTHNLDNELVGTPGDSETRNVVLITKREKARQSTKQQRAAEARGSRESERSRRRANERYQRAADALLDQIYTSGPVPHLSRDTKSNLKQNFPNSSAFERRSFDAKTKIRSQPRPSDTARNFDSKFSCRVTDFQLESSKNGKIPRVKTPHPRIRDRVIMDSD